MRILTLTREYPPHIYGGAGVHVEHLTRELAQLATVEVRCFGEQHVEGTATAPAARGFTPFAANAALARDRIDGRLWKAVEPLITNLAILQERVEADVVHCHTWYSMMAGLWIKILYDIPLVVTTHSLEPLRPWKEDQLGRGYHLSQSIEKAAIEAADAVIAVSEGTRREVGECYPPAADRVHVIHNGIDLERFRPIDASETLQEHGIDPATPYVLFVGRMTRQKGILHLLSALRHVRPDAQAVLCAGAPDTESFGAAIVEEVESLKSERPGVRWIPEMLPINDLVALYSGAAVFVCPSVYEPFGIINLEAMACARPVVASAVGGIPEVVVDGETGLLVPVQRRPAPDFEPSDPDAFARDLAAAIDRVLENPEAATRLGQAGRDRVEAQFSWKSIARKTLAVYEGVVARR